MCPNRELSARDVNTDEALRLGIVMELHDPEQLLPRAHALAVSFVNASPVAVGLVKRALATGGNDLASLLDVEASAQAVAMGTAQHHTAVNRFLQKEPALFHWPTVS